jgi:hypothetical protein
VVVPSCADSSNDGFDIDILLLVDTGIDSSRPCPLRRMQPITSTR